MNKEHARAWDDIETFAAQHGARLVRDGHRINYTWTHHPAPGSSTPEPIECLAWAEENTPRYGLRVGTISARFWNIDAAHHTLTALLAHPPTAAEEPGGEAPNSA